MSILSVHGSPLGLSVGVVGRVEKCLRVLCTSQVTLCEGFEVIASLLDSFEAVATAHGFHPT